MASIGLGLVALGRPAPARPWADVVLSGAATAATLVSNPSALRVPCTGKLEARLAGVREDAAGYSERRSTLPWNRRGENLAMRTAST